MTRAGIACLLACLAGCKLRDVVTAPLGAPVLVVESVLSGVGTEQSVLVQQSEAGDTTVGVSGARPFAIAVLASSRMVLPGM